MYLHQSLLLSSRKPLFSILWKRKYSHHIFNSVQYRSIQACRSEFISFQDRNNNAEYMKYMNNLTKNA